MASVPNNRGVRERCDVVTEHLYSLNLLAYNSLRGLVADLLTIRQRFCNVRRP